MSVRVGTPRPYKGIRTAMVGSDPIAAPGPGERRPPGTPARLQETWETWVGLRTLVKRAIRYQDL
jgi:hypothetical protein